MRIFTRQKREYALLYYRARSVAVPEYDLVSFVVYFLVIMSGKIIQYPVIFQYFWKATTGTLPERYRLILCFCRLTEHPPRGEGGITVETRFTPRFLFLVYLVPSG